MLEQGVIEGRTDGIHEDFYPNAKATPGEEKKHVTCSVYQGAYSTDADYDTMKPVASGLVELGEQRTRQIHPKKPGHYRDPKPGDRWHSDKFNGKLTTPLDVFDRNLRELVATMKKNPVPRWSGEPSRPCTKTCPVASRKIPPATTPWRRRS